ncbi:MAG: hypothetical protein LBD11_05425, partial [Candidatus Peribacteria bacterium]|nr:hypothetical protein [Candidatus Peribacteria bacterium]
MNATITFNKPNVTVTNNGGNTSYTFTGNGSFTFEFVDQYGNTGAETATVNRIDKTIPSIISMVYSPNAQTSGPVIVTITLNKPGTVVGWTKV